MRELLVRALLHQTTRGRDGAAEAAALLAAAVDNPRLQLLIPRSQAPFSAIQRVGHLRFARTT